MEREETELLPGVLEKRNDRISLPEKHGVVVLEVDECLDFFLDNPEVDDEPGGIELVGFHGDFCCGVVAMEEPALASVVNEPVAVAEGYSFHDSVHDWSLACMLLL